MIQPQLGRRKKGTDRWKHLHACMFMWGCSLLKGKGRFTPVLGEAKSGRIFPVFIELLEERKGEACVLKKTWR